MEQEDIDSIVRALEDEYAAAFTRRDAVALSSLFSSDATVLTEWGDVLYGRAQLEAALARAFPRMPATSRLVNTPICSRAANEDVIVSHGTSWKSGGPGSPEETLFYTRVYVWRNGVWQLTATQVAPASSLSDPRTSV